MSDDVGEGASNLLCLWVVENDQPDENEESCRETRADTQQQQEEMMGSMLPALPCYFQGILPARSCSCRRGSPHASRESLGWDMPWADSVPLPLLRSGILGGKPPPVERT